MCKTKATHLSDSESENQCDFLVSCVFGAQQGFCPVDACSNAFFFFSHWRGAFYFRADCRRLHASQLTPDGKETSGRPQLHKEGRLQPLTERFSFLFFQHSKTSQEEREHNVIQEIFFLSANYKDNKEEFAWCLRAARLSNPRCCRCWRSDQVCFAELCLHVTQSEARPCFIISAAGGLAQTIAEGCICLLCSYRHNGCVSLLRHWPARPLWIQVCVCHLLIGAAAATGFLQDIDESLLTSLVTECCLPHLDHNLTDSIFSHPPTELRLLWQNKKDASNIYFPTNTLMLYFDMNSKSLFFLNVHKGPASTANVFIKTSEKKLILAIQLFFHFR